MSLSTAERLSRIARPGFAIVLCVLSVLSPVSRAADALADAKSASLAPTGYIVAILEVTVNRQPQDEPITVLRDDKGQVLVLDADLQRWRLRLPAAASGVTHGNERYIRLSSFPGLEAKVDEGTQSLTIVAPSALFESTAIDAVAERGAIPVRSATGGFLNYTLLGSRADSSTTTAGSFEVGAFGRFGTLNATGVAAHSSEESSFTRLDTTWTYAMPSSLTTVRAGDAITRSGAWGNALRFGGVQFATDFATQPNLVLTPGQFAAGQATVPSTVDVFINNALVTQQSVRPGPFSITNIPPVTGSGNVTLVVRDELGREQVITRPFYASQTLLRPGLVDFSLDFGRVREDYGISSFDYGPWIGSATYRRGLSDRVTGEVRAEAGSGVANAGVAVSMLAATYGVLSLSAVGGHNREGNGSRFSFGFDRRSRGLSFSVQGTWASPRFRLAGELESDPATILAHEWLTSADYSLGRYGTVALAYVDRKTRNLPATRIGTLGYTLSLHRYGYVSASVSRIRAAEESSTLINVLWTMPLGSMTSVTTGLERARRRGINAEDNDERSITVQRNLPAGDGYGYRVQVTDQSTQQGLLAYQNRYGTYTAEVARNQGQTGERISASGGVGLISGTAFAGRLINESFGLVRLPGYPDVRVYAENRVIGRTDASGELVVPRLLPYHRNTVRIDQADIPLDAEFDVLQQDAVPFARSGVVVDFRVRPSRGALVQIVEADGTPVPAGAQVVVDGQDTASPVALEGESYLTGLSSRHRARVTWTDRACVFEFEYVLTTDPQPRLGPFVCR